MIAMCQHLKFPVPREFQLEPINSVAALLHWKALLLIAARLDTEEREYWREMFPAPPGMLPQRQRPQAFDAHFHLDRTLHSMGLPPHASLRAIFNGTVVEEDKEVDVVGTCASFCDPDTYPSAERLLDLPRDMVVAVRLHPKTKFQSFREVDDCFRHLRKLVQQERVTAVGEVGLDHTVPMRDWHYQMVNLQKILPLVTTRHVLVLHCRGMSHDNGTEVYMLLLSLVRQGVSRDQRIYLHCFNGDRYVLDQWTTAFPNLYLGFTRLVTSFTPHQSEALRKVEEGRILLETDAPYFSVRGRPWSAPNQLYSVAESVAAVLQMTPERLLEITTAN
ncbi:putative deoxyribonuclease TATDN2 [Pecten maximus]|uniref:putative deoxyribonuclease TATDN2 n=1 Tax=Pecten maximus TaxID=6579 RepID=UPI0014587C3E|nr:putative deoxyribonuclease TATDN2 [Pecten maximus]